MFFYTRLLGVTLGLCVWFLAVGCDVRVLSVWVDASILRCR